MRISDWSSDVCSSDLGGQIGGPFRDRAVVDFNANLAWLHRTIGADRLVGVDIGGRPVHTELTDAGVRQQPVELEVIAFGGDLTQIDQTVGEAVDATGAGTGDAIAELGVQRFHTQIELGRDLNRLYRKRVGLGKGVYV